MIVQSENMAQDEFIRQILERDIRNIFKAQQLVVAQGIYHSGKDLKATRRSKVNRHTGRLENALASPEYYMQSQGEEFNVAAVYPVYIRFMDMKRLGNRMLYNRQVWGILYNNALKDIRNGYGQKIADFVGDKLRESFSANSLSSN
ncbi:MAG: hypothetical protein LBR26_13310 [Prevotella sp.]|jgi:hypothetical protein|nr:hypothetical protein [Prevotella sp.]